MAATQLNIPFVSVDLDQCPNYDEIKRVDAKDLWTFQQMDDKQFAKHVPHNLDAIDFFPLLSPFATVVFHDTNMAKHYRRKNGTIGKGWDNERGIIHAIEEYFECCFNEHSAFVQCVGGCVVEHIPYCNGLTILARIDPHFFSVGCQSHLQTFCNFVFFSKIMLILLVGKLC